MQAEETSCKRMKYSKDDIFQMLISQYQFQIEFEDADAGDPNFDENIEGTIVSIVRLLRPTGNAVSVDAPSYSVQSALEVGG